MKLHDSHSKIRIFQGALALLLIFGLISTPHGNQTRIEVYTTNLEKDGQPIHQQLTEFDCSDRIYTVLEAQGLDSGKHKLKVSWIDPSGTQKELTRYEFDAYAFTRVWAWLQLSPPTSAIIGQVFDPSFGMEEFIGQWTAKVSIDGKLVKQHEFEVLC